MSSLSELHRLIASRAVGFLGREAVNLGIGIPTIIADLLGPDSGVTLETENGMLGVGPSPGPGQVIPSLINAGKQPVTETPGASYFSSAASFGLIRGGHISTAVLGALQIDERGCIANWAVPGRPILGVGGAMDLMVGARRIIVTTTHLTRSGTPKIVKDCTLPLTSDRSVDVIVTEAATFLVRDRQLELADLAPGVSLEWLVANTGAEFAPMGATAA